MLMSPSKQGVDRDTLISDYDGFTDTDYEGYTDGEYYTEGEQDDWGSVAEDRAYVRCCYMLGLVNICDAIEYGLIMPSLYLFLQDVSKKKDQELLYGCLIAVFSFSSFVFKPVLAKSVKVIGFKWVYLLSMLLAIGGNILYAFASMPSLGIWALFVGRALSGIGAANTSLAYGYISSVVPSPRKRTNIIMALGLTFPIGMVLGPATNLLTHYFHNAKNQVTIPGANITLTDNSSPGLLLACLLLIVSLCILCFLKEPPGPPSLHRQQQLRPGTMATCVEMTRPAVFACFVVVFAFNFFISTTEAIVVPITNKKFGYSALQNALVYGGCALEIIALSSLVRWLLQKLHARSLVIFAALLYGGGSAAAYFLWTNADLHQWKFLVGQYSALAAIPFAFAPNRALFQKLVERLPPMMQGSLSSLLALAASFGSILGPIFMGYSLRKGIEKDFAQHVFVPLWGICGFVLLFALGVWFGLDPAPHQSRPQDQAAVAVAAHAAKFPTQQVSRPPGVSGSRILPAEQGTSELDQQRERINSNEQSPPSRRLKSVAASTP